MRVRRSTHGNSNGKESWTGWHWRSAYGKEDEPREQQKRFVRSSQTRASGFAARNPTRAPMGIAGQKNIGVSWRSELELDNLIRDLCLSVFLSDGDWRTQRSEGERERARERTQGDSGGLNGCI